MAGQIQSVFYDPDQLFGLLDRGASEISTMFGFNDSFGAILTGIILFFIIGCEFFLNYEMHFRKSSRKECGMLCLISLLLSLARWFRVFLLYGCVGETITEKAEI